ncbi:hypothetical protein MLD52_08370 [Puniceicoccaceae bacterium K14]|nr:hypothetical protein [Puniceicoccaceae bacterium K14]
MMRVSKGGGRSSWAKTLWMAVRGLCVLKFSSWGNARTLGSLLGMASIVGFIAFLIGGESEGATLKSWIEDEVSGIIVPLICLSLTGGLIRSEIRDGTIEYLWTRSVTKSQLILGTYICAVGGAMLTVAFLDFILCGVLFLEGNSFVAGELVALVFAQGMAVIAYCALSLAIAAIFSKYMIVGVLYGVLVEIWLASVPSKVALISVSYHLNAVIRGEEAYSSFTSGLAIALVALVTSMFVFSSKSYTVGKKSD